MKITNCIATSEIISPHCKVEFKFIHMYIFNHHFSGKDFYKVQLDSMQFLFQKRVQKPTYLKTHSPKRCTFKNIGC